MTSRKVDVHELIAWGLDEYSYRDDAAGFDSMELDARIGQASARLAERDRYTSASALLDQETRDIQPLFATATQREDLLLEYRGLDWTLGVVDLRLLLAFQRRLIFSPSQQVSTIPVQGDWPGLISLAVGSQRSTEHVLVRNGSDIDRLDIGLHSSNPDLQLRLTPKTSGCGALPLSLYGGSPFFEVAEFRGRWFLRDGYHRAYHLLQAGVNRIPAVVIYARSIEELGATASWFFDEEQLFSDRPPQVKDFLDSGMILSYERTALRKVIRIRVEESLEPFDEVQEQGERL
ncbi:hypothetical protein [Tunturibacter empetritectus]|uniref:Uncharacterized protein n=1 Tax=Tunturiibacter lichenicola TaxID=2051959 RepID=A0A7W8J689_9BACT|nr:hypothetical protein [Edaphobacter lichenicola]MBB5342291.1 hypothetical protein [Edaphobacter lichenicola]